MSKQQTLGRARARRVWRIRFDTDGRGNVRAFVCSRGHRHATFIKALECAGRRNHE